VNRFGIEYESNICKFEDRLTQTFWIVSLIPLNASMKLNATIFLLGTLMLVGCAAVEETSQLKGVKWPRELSEQIEALTTRDEVENFLKRKGFAYQFVTDGYFDTFQGPYGSNQDSQVLHPAETIYLKKADFLLATKKKFNLNFYSETDYHAVVFDNDGKPLSVHSATVYRK
jgi:hypothetical protein